MQIPAHIDISNNFKLVANELEQVRRIIFEQTDTLCRDKSLGRLVRSFNVRSGKMIRPALLLLCGACFGQITDEHIQIAAVMELLHNATLLHDDVIDEGQIRRGQATVNRLYGNEAAVLLGDFLLSRVFKMCSFLESEIIKTISATAARICEGELRQTVHKRDWNLSQAEYIEIITEKTVALFSTCCRLGSHLAGAQESQAQSLSDYGSNFGIAFQIADDLVDIAGDENKSGKTLGSDADKNKPTLPLIFMLSRLNEKKKTELIKELNAERSNSRKIKRLFEDCCGIEYVREQIQIFVNNAVEAIVDLPDSEAKKALIETACSMGNAARTGQKQS
jgi:octaprenyl-diphosphate synthase